MIVTFYNEVISPEILDLQKKIFNKFGLEINQIFVKNWKNHGESVDEYLKLKNDPKEIVVLFDIDCIPLNNTIVPNAVKWCSQNVGIFSVAQKAVKLKLPIIHAAPSFMVFSIETFNILGRPSFTTNIRSDCGAEMTHNARQKGVEIRMLYPTYIDSPHSYLDGYIQFGYGTNYENKIFHSFESRHKKKDNFFIKKCNEILGI